MNDQKGNFDLDMSLKGLFLLCCTIVRNGVSKCDNEVKEDAFDEC